MRRFFQLLPLAAIAALSAAPVHAAADAGFAKGILIRSIGFKTVAGQGQVPHLAAYYASILTEAGYKPSEIEITPMGETATLVVTLKGRDPRLKPIGLIGHMDVVEARKEDWTRDPFVAVEEGGYIYGRGAEDNKYDVAMMVATMAQLRKEGFRPRRDVILMLSGDEETAMQTAPVLARKYGNLELLLNGDGGGGTLDDDGKPVTYQLQAGEKSYGDYEIVLTDPGGHSSAPTPTNPIYRLARALDRLSAYQFPPMLNELTRAWLSATGKTIGGADGAAMESYARDRNGDAADRLSSNPKWVGQIRTTCVATQIGGGHAPNALPQRATATVNCRIFPGVTLEAVRDEIARIINEPAATVRLTHEPVFSDASPLRPDVVGAVNAAVKARYPGLEVVPEMTVGTTDSLFFRGRGIPSYGVSTLFQKPGDSFAHGLNERVPTAGIGASLRQWHDLITALAK